VIAFKKSNFSLTSNWINFLVVVSINPVNFSKFFLFHIIFHCEESIRVEIYYSKSFGKLSRGTLWERHFVVSSKLRIHKVQRRHVRARGPRGRCKLGGNISAVKYLSRLTRRRGGSYHSIGVRTWHEIYYARYIAISSTSAVEYVTLYTTVTVMQVDPCLLSYAFSFT